MLERIKNEPAVVLGLVQAVLGLVLAFGLELSNEQVGAIMAVTAAVLSLVVRSRVTPVGSGEPDEAGQSNAVLLLLVAVLVVVVLILFGVKL